MSKIFEIGVAKTGSTSLHKALQILGFNVTSFQGHGKDMHYFDMLKPCNYNYTMNMIKQGEAFEDVPWRNLPIRLIDPLFPESKFILLERNNEEWFNSLLDHWKRKWTITNGVHKEYNNYLKYPEYIRKKYYKRKSNKYRRVKEFFSKDVYGSLLVMNICEGDGWDKLCSFLNLPTPNEKFPHERTSKSEWDNLENKKRWLQKNGFSIMRNKDKI